jgi:hypothetical protein
MKISNTLLYVCEHDDFIIDKPRKGKFFHIWQDGDEVTLCGRSIDKRVRRWVIPTTKHDVCNECEHLMLLMIEEEE